ncbi:hypothetical protein DXG01_011998 [Tephrocybe rancida]|nr:hypothetical protein DXG01_011998 [Tephrocybe rancida]
MDRLAEIPSSSAGPGFASYAGCIRHTTPRDTGRYDRGAKVESGDIVLDAGRVFASEPAPNYLPLQWLPYIHPEGQLYFSKDAATPRVVTEANLHDPKIFEKVEYWAHVVENLLSESLDIVLSNDVELFLQIEENDCAYYFVDHQSQTTFWLDTLDTDEIGIPPVASPSHLRIALQELYWTHVEYFPAHLACLAPRALEELIGVFTHGQAEPAGVHSVADHLTSSTSTFPYDAQDCSKFLKLLRTFRASFVASTLLVHCHELLDDATATDATAFLRRIRSPGAKFQWVAFVYALPKALFFWGVLAFVANCLVVGAVAAAGDAARL